MATVLQLKQGYGPGRHEITKPIGSEVEFFFDDGTTIWLAISMFYQLEQRYEIVAYAIREQEGRDYDGRYVIEYDSIAMTGTCTCYSLEEQSQAKTRELASTN